MQGGVHSRNSSVAPQRKSPIIETGVSEGDVYSEYSGDSDFKPIRVMSDHESETRPSISKQPQKAIKTERVQSNLRGPKAPSAPAKKAVANNLVSVKKIVKVAPKPQPPIQEPAKTPAQQNYFLGNIFKCITEAFKP